MQLAELLQGVPIVARTVPLSLEVQSIFCDSKAVQEGSLFVAVRGTQEDGHGYVEEALRRGAVAAVIHPEAKMLFPPRTPVIMVADTNRALLALAKRFYGDPASQLRLIGVTGTNGKTTVTYLIEYLLRRAGIAIGRLGTVNYQLGDRVLPSTNTTPGPLQLQRLFRQMVAAQLQGCVMEASSHALDQRRTAGLAFRVGVFLNLASDHLDYHQTLAAYFAAKARLFDQLASPGWAVVNADDSSGAELLRRLRLSPRTPHLLTFGLEQPADVTATDLRDDAAGTSCAITMPQGRWEGRVPLVGSHNIANLLAAVGAVCASGWSVDLQQALSALQDFRGVPGRLEKLGDTGETSVYVDYAHTEAALAQVLATLRAQTQRRLIVVFGCGGDRDRSKRAGMGRLASELADWVIVTSDNPRSEPPEAIIREIVHGFPAEFRAYDLIVDRAQAIERAVTILEPGDVLLIAGKGHETYQVIGRTTVPFDDRRVALACLQRQRQRIKPTPVPEGW